MQTHTCIAPQVAPKIENKLKKLVRRIKEEIKPTLASVRWDTSANKWAVLTPENKPHHHFSFGVMTNVKFSSVKVREHVGCGNVTTTYIGIATGMLIENSHGRDGIGFHNLQFKDGHFRANDGSEIQSATVLRLMSERTSVYK